jgi:hypothetical protein
MEDGEMIEAEGRGGQIRQSGRGGEERQKDREGGNKHRWKSERSQTYKQEGEMRDLKRQYALLIWAW